MFEVQVWNTEYWISHYRFFDRDMAVKAQQRIEYANRVVSGTKMVLPAQPARVVEISK